MNDLIIKNVFAVLPDRVTDTAISVLVRDGRIAEIDTNTTDSSLPVVDGNGVTFTVAVVLILWMQLLKLLKLLPLPI